MTILDRVRRVARSPGIGGVLLRGAGGSFVVRVAGVGVGFLWQVALARLLGAAPYGVYVLALTVLNVLGMVAVAGLDTALVRYVADYHARQRWGALRGVLRRSSQIVLGLGLTLAVLLLGVLRWTDLGDASGLAATLARGAPMVPLLALILLRQSALRGLKRAVAAQVPDLILRPLLLVALALVAFRALDGQLAPPTAMTLHVGATAAAFVAGAAYLLACRPAAMRGVRPRYRSAEWMRTALPLLLVSTMFLILNRVDTLMIGMLRGPDEVGVYNAAAMIATLVLFGLQAINMIAAPMISEYHATRDRDELQQLVRRVAVWIFWVSLPIVTFVVALGAPLLGLFGDGFRDAYPVLLWLAAGQAVNVSTGPVGFLLTMTGHERVGLRILVVSLVVNVVLNVPAIHWFGIEGAAAATGLSIALRNLLMWQAARERLRVDASVWGCLGRRGGAIP